MLLLLFPLPHLDSQGLLFALMPVFKPTMVSSDEDAAEVRDGGSSMHRRRPWGISALINHQLGMSIWHGFGTLASA